MIQSKEDLNRYLETERKIYLDKMYGVTQHGRLRPHFKEEYEWKFIRSLRYVEYWKNVLKNSGGGYKKSFSCRDIFFIGSDITI